MGGKHEFDSLTHAQPARITVDPDRNTQGDELATNIVYDYYTGLVTSSTDPNGRVVTTSYANQLLPGGVSDPYGRPGVVTDPLGHRTTTRHFDSILKAEISADLNFPGDGKLRRLASADQLGRAIKSETSEDGFTYTTSSDSIYHQMGRIVFQSNPHRTVGASTDGWTRTTKDTLGRIIDVTSFSGQAIPPDSGGTGSTGSV